MTVAIPKRKWRPRFSLRSLVLTVLLIASGFGLWWRWEPWVQKLVVADMGGVSQQMRFTPDGKGLMAWVSSKTDAVRLVLFEVATGERRWQVNLDEVECFCSFSQDASRILLASKKEDRSKVRILSVESGLPISTVTIEASIMLAEYTPLGPRLVTRGDAEPGDPTNPSSSPFVQKPSDSGDGPRDPQQKHSIRVWDAETGLLLTTCNGIKFDLQDVILSPRGDMLVSFEQADQNPFDVSTLKSKFVARVWDIRTGEQTLALELPPQPVFIFDPANQQDGVIQTTTGLGCPFGSSVFSPNGTHVYTNVRDGDGPAAVVWNPTTGKLIEGFRFKDNWVIDSRTQIEPSSFSKEGRTLLSSAFSSGGCPDSFLIDALTGEKLLTVSDSFPVGFLADETRIVLEHQDQGYRFTHDICDAKDGSVLASVPHPPIFNENPLGIAISPAGERIAVMYDEKIHIYHRRRPEWWWGIFWLWETWATMVFGTALIWSLIRDHRIFGQKLDPEIPLPST